jgi:hypothetical protein
MEEMQTRANHVGMSVSTRRPEKSLDARIPATTTLETPYDMDLGSSRAPMAPAMNAPPDKM